ncbi:hypothetical protein ACOMHN_006112 [Nucella lapillus]
MTSGELLLEREFGEYDTDPDERGAAKPKKVFFPKEVSQVYTIPYMLHNTCERFKELAKPKEPNIGWHTCVGQRLMYGTQDSLWPMSPYAMAATPSPRTQTLARPKKNFQIGTVHEGRPIYYYGVGRPSVIWTVSDGAKNGSSTERLKFLAKHKEHNPGYSEDKEQFFYSFGRETPIWKVKHGAMKCPDRPHTILLALHKEYHPDFKEERPIESNVTPAAQNAVASDRVYGLAMPRQHDDGPFRDPVWPVSQKARTSVASPRCLELAHSKPLAEGFQLARGIEWPVSRAAIHAHATPRVEELSRPITRDTMDNVQFNTTAFTVKRSALKGVIPQRILEELSRPSQR